MNISITDKAKNQLAGLGVDDKRFLRISVQTGGCSGNSYDATIEDEMKDQDEVFFEDGSIRVISDQYSSLFIDGLNIDYSDDLIEPGFRLTNNNAKGSCGCGASFSV